MPTKDSYVSKDGRLGGYGGFGNLSNLINWQNLCSEYQGIGW